MKKYRETQDTKDKINKKQKYTNVKFYKETKHT